MVCVDLPHLPHLTLTSQIRLIATDPNVVELATRTLPVLCFLIFW